MSALTYGDEQDMVVQLLARAMYKKLCAFKGYEPKGGMYADAGSIDYASLAVDLLGYDDEAMDRLREVAL